MISVTDSAPVQEAQKLLNRILTGLNRRKESTAAFCDKQFVLCAISDRISEATERKVSSVCELKLSDSFFLALFEALKKTWDESTFH